MSADFYTRRSWYRESFLSFCGEQNDLYLLTEMHGNTGDHLIWAGTRDLLESGGISTKSMPISEIEKHSHKQSTLLVPGSGAFHRFWHEWLPEVVIKAAHNFHKVIILPSSFDLSEPIVKECLSLANVFAFARETKSYRAIKSLGRAGLFFDCAVYFHRFSDIIPYRNVPTEGGGLLLALRNDNGSLLPIYGFQSNSAVNDDISLTKVELNMWIDAIDKATTIVTDRLHVAVASVLLGKELIYFDPYDKKISTYFDYTFRDTFCDRIKCCSLEWLLENNFIIKKEKI